MMLTAVVCGEAGPGTVIDITCDVDEDCAEFENLRALRRTNRCVAWRAMGACRFGFRAWPLPLDPFTRMAA